MLPHGAGSLVPRGAGGHPACGGTPLGLSRVRCLAVLALTAALLLHGATISGAHGSHAERERETSERIAKAPRDPLNYVERADVYREAGHLAEAEADLARAAALAPDHPAVMLLAAQLRLDRKDPAAAGRILDSLLARDPRNAKARSLRADALETEGRVSEAAQQLERSITDTEQPAPDQYLRLARLLTASRPPDSAGAVRALERGVARLGPAPGLVGRRVELALAMGRAEEALAWHDRLRPFMQSDPAWLVRRGELLEVSRRTLEALAAYTAALEAIEALPPRRRAARVDAGLEAEVRAKLHRSTPSHKESP